MTDKSHLGGRVPIDCFRAPYNRQFKEMLWAALFHVSRRLAPGHGGDDPRQALQGPVPRLRRLPALPQDRMAGRAAVDTACPWCRGAGGDRAGGPTGGTVEMGRRGAVRGGLWGPTNGHGDIAAHQRVRLPIRSE